MKLCFEFPPARPNAVLSGNRRQFPKTPLSPKNAASPKNAGEISASSSPVDPVAQKDRQDRETRSRYDAIRRLREVTDPLGRTTKYEWCTCGGLSKLTDANGNETTWTLDLQGRVR